jgi:hypothetical protein
MSGRRLTCRRCGDLFDAPVRPGPAPSYCSWHCKIRSQPSRVEKIAEPVEKVCGWCWQPFIARAQRLPHSTCGKRCSKLLYQQQQVWGEPNACPLPLCIDCRTPYSPGSAHAKLRLRCEQCRRRAGRDIERERARSAHRRRVVAGGDDIEILDIAVRDRFTCWICEGKVNVMIRWPDPWSPSLDHVLPIAQGGEHLVDNVRLSHLRCNIQREHRRRKSPFTSASADQARSGLRLPTGLGTSAPAGR